MDKSLNSKTVPESLVASVKSRFFAQYWGTKTLYVGGVGKVEVGTGGWNLKHPDFFLQLKSISNLSDEDAIYVAQLMTNFKWNLDFGTKVISEDNQIRIYYDAKSSGFKHTTTIYDDFFGRNYLGEPIQPLSGEVFDYLRSKGYAIPFMEYSVDDLISLGWVQLL